MKLKVAHRSAERKSDAKKLRREGNIPAILYSKGEKGKDIVVDGIEFKKILNTIQPGTLSSKVFSLEIDGKEVKALLKDIQYHVTTYNVLHLDFTELHDDIEINVKIPIVCTGAMDCAGVKLGGVLRQVIRHLKVRTLPKNIPDAFEIGVKNLGLGQTKRLSDIKLPSNVSPIGSLEEVAVVIGRR